MERPRPVVVAGQVARDLALRVRDVPAAGTSAAVCERIEVLGGKGANQAVALAQLGMAPALLGVVGDDAHGADVLDRARRDGVDTGPVVHRAGARTGLIVDVVDGDGDWRYLEDLPPEVLLTRSDVEAAADTLAGSGTAVLQLQQPVEAVCAAADLARGGGATVVLDGAPPDPSVRADLLARADVLRADAREAALWGDGEVRSADAALRLAAALRARGPGMVVLGAGAAGNVVAWDGGTAVVPLSEVEVIDSTGAGDAFVAGLVTALGRGPRVAAEWGSAAAASTVSHVGGRPRLAPAAWLRGPAAGTPSSPRNGVSAARGPRRAR